MFDMRYARQRGGAYHAGLRSRFTFSFGDYWDPKQVGFSSLLIINEDVIEPSKGVRTHSHRNMEIITYVLEGSLEHKDSMGNGSVITQGDVQLMSAGSGVTHSEFNPSATEEVHLLQIWVVPNIADTIPKYQQIYISPKDKRGKLHLIIAKYASEKTLSIQQDINIYVGCFHAEETANFSILEERYIYLHIAKGRIQVNDQIFNTGDAARIRHGGNLHFHSAEHAEILIFDMQTNEVPKML